MLFYSNRLAVAVAAIGLLTACATTGATFGSGVGDAYLEHPPYYAGASLTSLSGDTSRIGHLPIAFQRGAAQPAIFDPRTGRGTAMDALLNEMNTFIDKLGISVRLAATTPGASHVPPDVRFGCIPENGVPGNECAERGDSALGRGSQRMQLTVGRPSSEWTSWMASAANSAGAQRVLVVTLEIGDYLTRQQGLVGNKIVELGTGNTARLPWLTSLETPVTVLQLTAALVGQDGKAVRIGAEGFYARRTRLTISALGGQELLLDEDVSAVRAARRDDLPGAPLAWQVALRELVTRVSGKSATAAAP
jgi:hypothetical protein